MIGPDTFPGPHPRPPLGMEPQPRHQQIRREQRPTATDRHGHQRPVLGPQHPHPPHPGTHRPPPPSNWTTPRCATATAPASAMLRQYSAWIGVRKDNGQTRVAMTDGLAMDSNWNTTSTGTERASAPISGGTIWLRVNADIHPGSGRQAHFSYSTDGVTFTNLGPGYTLTTTGTSSWATATASSTTPPSPSAARSPSTASTSPHRKTERHTMMNAPSRSARSSGHTRLRKLLSLLSACVVAIGMSVAISAPADAASTLGAAAAQKGRYFGAAVAAGKLSDSTYIDDPEPRVQLGHRRERDEVGRHRTVAGPVQLHRRRPDRQPRPGQRHEVRGHALLWHRQQPGWAQSMSGTRAAQRGDQPRHPGRHPLPRARSTPGTW